MKKLSPTLFDSFQYYLSIEDEEESGRVRGELLARLRREPLEPNEAMQRGQMFEDDVRRFCLTGQLPDGPDAYLSCAQEIAALVKDGLYQQEIHLVTGDVEWTGFIDFLKRNWIYDVKTTAKYEIGKYSKRLQHIVYLLAMKPYGIDRFAYLVTDFNNVYREDYTYLPGMEEELQSAVTEFFGYLENDPEMKDAYENIYCKTEAQWQTTIKSS